MSAAPGYENFVKKFRGRTHFTDSKSRVSKDFEDHDRFPWYSPTLSDIKAGDIGLFPESISDTEVEARYERYQLVRVIINDVVEDAFRNGFFILNLSDQEDSNMDAEFQALYETTIQDSLIRSIIFCRLDGYSTLYFGYGDLGKAELKSPPHDEERIKHLVPLRKTQFEMSTTDTLPAEVEYILVNFSGEGEEEVNSARFIHLENKSLANDCKGQSALAPIWDLLTVQKHADWSIGQDLWRGSTGLLTLFAPAGTTSADATSALDAIDNITAKTRLVLPPGFDAKDMAPARVAYNVKHAYDIVVRQIAAGTRIPEFLLNPSFRHKAREVDPEYLGFLYSLQTSFITPLLRNVFKKFQGTAQLPEGEFRILWKKAAESPYDESASLYMRALAKKFEIETQSIQAKEIKREGIKG